MAAGKISQDTVSTKSFVCKGDMVLQVVSAYHNLVKGKTVANSE